jgi:hypothetical protein
MDRYGDDVLAPGWRAAKKPVVVDVPVRTGLIVEVDRDGFTGELVGWENGFVLLEDRRGARRSFPFGTGFHIEGSAVRLCPPRRAASAGPAYTASGSRASAPGERAKVALPSRIFVEGRHDAELVEKVWGDDLRHVGVVVEFLGGVDNLAAEVAAFGPAPGRRLGVLVDHLVTRSKEFRIAAEIARAGYGDVVLIVGHRFIDVWQAIRPEVVGFPAWPVVPPDVDFKKGTLAALGLPHANQADIAGAWRGFLAGVRTYKDIDPDFTREVERLIDFVTQDG